MPLAGSPASRTQLACGVFSYVLTGLPYDTAYKLFCGLSASLHVLKARADDDNHMLLVSLPTPAIAAVMAIVDLEYLRCDVSSVAISLLSKPVVRLPHKLPALPGSTPGEGQALELF
jgi:hypothetical protein